MDKVQRYVLIGVGTLYAAVITVGAYAKIWEHLQPTDTLKGVKVVHAISYNRDNELHWTMNGVRVLVQGESRPIDIPSSELEPGQQIKERDTVDVVVRRSFPWPGSEPQLDGLTVRVSKSTDASQSPPK